MRASLYCLRFVDILDDLGLVVPINCSYKKKLATKQQVKVRIVWEQDNGIIFQMNIWILDCTVKTFLLCKKKKTQKNPHVLAASS